MAAEKPLIVIVGPTASGKTGLAIKLAKRFNGAVICADSRTVYRGMNIGTAKPTVSEMDGIKHYMLDLVEPNQRFTVYDFQRLTNRYVREIRNNSQTPFLVGGSGLYVDSVIFDYKIGPEVDQKLRKRLEAKSVLELQAIILKNQIEMPNNSSNKRYLIRAIEQGGVNKTRNSSIKNNIIVVGITTEKSDIEQRIRERVAQMLQNGFIEEVSNLANKYGDLEPFRNNLYGVAQSYLRGEISQADLLERMVIVDRQLVKKQLTWFKRNPHIKWCSLAAAEAYVKSVLSE